MAMIREERKYEILKAACEVFGEKGFKGTKIEEIAQQVGIGKSTVYEYFPSKSDLLCASCDWIFEKILSDVTKIMKSDNDFSLKIKDYIRYSSELLYSLGNGMLLFHGKTEDFEVIRSHVKLFHDKLITLISEEVTKAAKTGYIREDISPKSIAYMISFVPTPKLGEMLANGDTTLLNDTAMILMEGILPK